MSKNEITRRQLLAAAMSGVTVLSLPASTQSAEIIALDNSALKIGMFYTAWWDEQDRFHSWQQLHGPNQSVPVLGNYGAGDPKIIRRQYEMMRECGIDFLIFDDTNSIFVDDSIVDHNIKAWFDFMDSLPPQERLWLCIAFGGELNQHNNSKSFYEAADYLYTTYAQRPSVLTW